MQFYQGPSRRVLRRFQSDSNITIDGIVDQEEERGLFVKQSFQLEQFRDPGGAEFNMGNMWFFDYEEDFNVQAGGRSPFAGEHTITDRLLLNKTFRNLTFSPEGCNNFLTVDSNATTRLAPLLCADSTYNNVTRPPVITTDGADHQPNVYVQMGAYNRFWFGAVDNMSDHPAVANRTGHAPYTVANYAAPLYEGIGLGNHAVYTAYGFEPSKMPAPQALRRHAENIMLGQQGVLNGSTTGLITWRYDKVNDNYYTLPFEVQIPFPLNQVVYSSTFTVPSMRTASITDMQPFNYFFTGDPVSNPREDVPPVVQIVAAGVINETFNTYDFVKVLLTRVDDVVGAAINGVGNAVLIREVYMFVPAFRIANGNNFRSIGRPRRYAQTSAATSTQPWIHLNATPMSALTGGATDLPSQVPFWANFQNLRGEKQHVGENALFDYVKVGHLTVIANDVNDPLPLFTLKFMAENTLPAAFKTQLDVIVDNCVTNRTVGANEGNFNASLKEVMFLYKDTQTDFYGYYRVKLDELNTFRADDGTFNGQDFGGIVTFQGWREGLWALHRSVQIELLPHRNGKYLKENISPFRSEGGFEVARRIDDAQNRADALAGAVRISESVENGKPFDLRSSYNFMANTYESGADPRPALTLPQRQMGGTLNAGDLAFYEDERFELFIPVQREVPNTLVAPSTVTVECCEPFFGYCSGSSQLGCQHPFDTRRLGKNYPIFLQDMSYSYSRDARQCFSGDGRISPGIHKYF